MKTDFIFIIVLLFIFYHVYMSNKIELMADITVTDQVKEAIRQVYLADVEAIRNLSNVATQLQAGGLTIPGDLTIKGKLNVVSDITTSANINSVNLNSTNLSVSGNFNMIPKGTIIAFNSDTAPVGWALCDGNNGTPDLRGRFIRMVSSGLTDEAGATGGFNKNFVAGRKSKAGVVDASFIGNSRNDSSSWIFKMALGDYGGTDHHVLDLNEMPSHVHSHRDTYWSERNGDDASFGDRLQGANGNDGDNKMLTVGRNTGAAGGSWGHNNMPPYYVLSYIMKL